VRAVWRQLRQENNWEKTRHVGAHRSVVRSQATTIDE
jgi:hypothetical protein